MMNDKEMDMFTSEIDDRNRKVLELAEKLANVYPVSVEEAMYYIEKAIIGNGNLYEGIKKVWNEIAQAFKEIARFLLDDCKYEDKKKWSINWDTRKKSQVILNKPKFFMRKVIR
ncbi:hypothetical protein [Bacillus sp. FJAT-49736]|uniref:hypothetical protein n=1 Tax=Bacillus sp. FJAT-49736 TaxID=2833582 RepID=UPI001BC90C5E|nr:hypothetical protein [Bacillus sp. FJAT-49736]MBS4172107.1 hypothetical protein [Bacillus sp. FJAT-49736]